MTERDRLVELMEEWYKQDEVDSLADHLLANGVIVLPCKVGDTLWILWSYYSNGEKKVCPVQVKALRFDTKKNNKRICVSGTMHMIGYDHHYNGTFTWDSIGKTLFLTKEEADRELERRKGNENIQM